MGQGDSGVGQDDLADLILKAAGAVTTADPAEAWLTVGAADKAIHPNASVTGALE